MNKVFHKNLFISILMMLFFISCAKRPLAPSIANNKSYPIMDALDSSHFLVLNTNANEEYASGSIQTYSVSSSGDYTLQSTFEIPSHGSSMAVTSDKAIIAVGFDSSFTTTQIYFYNYNNPKNSLILNLAAAGAKQSIKNIKFFTPNSNLAGNYYYLYGTIFSFPQDNGSNNNIPTRVFVARIAKDLSSSNVMFYLSYGLKDPNSLAQKSKSLIPQDISIQYTFGSSSPSFYTASSNLSGGGDRNLILAFPTGSIGGDNQATSDNTFPGLPDPFQYLSGLSNENINSTVLAPDMRTVSLMAVDFDRILQGDGLNNSTYFVPIAWNQNGIPYGALTSLNPNNSDNIPSDIIQLTLTNNTDSKCNNQSPRNPVSSEPSNVCYPNTNHSNHDFSSFSFQYGFWASNWVNMPSLGVSTDSWGTLGGDVSGCYGSMATATATSSLNNYNLSLVAGNSLLVAKLGKNGSNDFSDIQNSNGIGYGNEIFQITGLDLLMQNINTIRNAKNGVISAGESDFESIVKYQMIDVWNSVKSSINSIWPVPSNGVLGVGPLTYYMYSRTTDIKNETDDYVFNASMLTAITDFGVLNFGSNHCLPFWTRDTNRYYSSLGMDSAWLGASPTAISAFGSNTIFYHAITDPTQPVNTQLDDLTTGAQTCTSISPILNTPNVFCSNFLTGQINKFNVENTYPVFTKF